VKGYAPASIVDLLRADIWPPALQLISRRLANRDHGRADAPAARAPLDYGKVLRFGKAQTLQQRAACSAARNKVVATTAPAANGLPDTFDTPPVQKKLEVAGAPPWH